MDSLPGFSRRALLATPLLAAVSGCRKKLGTGYQGVCLVADQAGREIVAVDLIGFRVRGRAPLSAAPSAMLAHPTQPRAFALAPSAGTIFEIDAATCKVARKATPGSSAPQMRLSLAGDALWVLVREPSPMLVEFHIDTLTPARRIRLAAQPDGFDLGKDGRAAVWHAAAHSVEVVSLEHSRVERTIPLPAPPSFAIYRADGLVLMVATREDRRLSVFDSATGSLMVRLPLPVEPRSYVLTPDAGQLFISGEGMDAVAIVYPYNTEIDQTILAGHVPGCMAISSSTPSYLMVANPASANLTVFNVDTRKLVSVVQVGQEPASIIFTPDQQYALVLNRRSGDLAVIRLAGLAPAANAIGSMIPSGRIFTMIPVGTEPVDAAVVALT